jgi:hypothetical protein
MSLYNITSDSLRSLIKLTEKKDSILAEISNIEAEISSFLTGKPAPVKKSKTVPSKKTPKAKKVPAKSTSSKRGRRGGLGNKIVAALEAAGEDGVKVVDLAQKLKVKAGNLHVWFATTGKKNAAIKKVGKGQYRLFKK